MPAPAPELRPESDDERCWLWPWILGGLVCADIWLTTLGVWWFGWWPQG